MLETDWVDLLDPKDPLINYRKKWWDCFQQIGLPQPKQEAFQYVTKKWAFPKCAERRILTETPRSGLVFVDGFFEEGLSQISEPLICMSLEEAMRTYGLFLQSRFISTLSKEKDPFAALNGAFLGRGAFLHVPPKCKVTLHLNQIYKTAETATPRLHIYLGRHAELKLIQTMTGDCGFSNSCVDLVLDHGADCVFIDHSGGDVQSIRATLKKESRMKTVLLGTQLRTSVRFELVEEGCEANLLGLARLNQSEELHIHAHIEHVAPNTRSRQHVKSVLKDRARFSFEGKIYVHPEAQKTESYQLNNNLLLSDEASANAKPNLEIFADDVKASHGSTTSQLNDEELFYLRSRGLGVKEAQELLIDGFCKEITDHAR